MPIRAVLTVTVFLVNPPNTAKCHEVFHPVRMFCCQVSLRIKILRRIWLCGCDARRSEPYSSFGLRGSLTPVQVFEVTVSLTNNEAFVRIAAFAAFLACTLFGKPLHDLHHALEDASVADSASHSCGNGHHRCRWHSESPADCEPSQQESPKHSHDSHNCAVCVALCITATAPESPAVSFTVVATPWQVTTFSETLSGRSLHSEKARGPPCAG